MRGLFLLSIAALFVFSSCSRQTSLKKLRKEIREAAEDVIAHDPAYKPGGEVYEGRNQPPKWLPSEIQVGDSLSFVRFEQGGFSFWRDSISAVYVIDSVLNYKDGVRVVVVNDIAKIIIYDLSKWTGINAFFGEFTHRVSYDEKTESVPGKFYGQDIFDAQLWKGNVSLQNRHFHPTGYELRLIKQKQ